MRGLTLPKWASGLLRPELATEGCTRGSRLHATMCYIWLQYAACGRGAAKSDVLEARGGDQRRSASTRSCACDVVVRVDAACHDNSQLPRNTRSTPAGAQASRTPAAT